MIELDRIKKENERTEEEIMSEFEKLRPGLLGYICDILVNALEIKPTLKLETFHEWQTLLFGARL